MTLENGTINIGGRVINWSVLITSVATALVLGFFTFLTTQQSKTAEIMAGIVTEQRVAAEQMAYVRASLNEIKGNMDDRYTASDARKDQQAVNTRITALADSINNRITANENRIRDVERTVDRNHAE